MKVEKRLVTEMTSVKRSIALTIMCACFVVAASVIAIMFREMHSAPRVEALPTLRFLVRAMAAFCGSVCVMIAYDSFRASIAGIPSVGYNQRVINRINAATWGFLMGAMAYGFFYVTSKLDSVLRSVSGVIN